MNGPIAQDALLSFALPSSNALRPSKSRRLTSLPSVAPTVRPLPFTARTISGSGLFHSDFGWMPTSAPNPTADIGCDLVKISASGPMPTSRYCDQAPCRISASFTLRRLGRAGADLRQVVADHGDDFAAHGLRLRRVAARLFLDDPFQRAGDERDAGGLERLQVARRQEPRQRRVARVRARNWRARRRSRPDAAAGRRRGSRPPDRRGPTTGSTSRRRPTGRRCRRPARARARVRRAPPRRRGRPASRLQRPPAGSGER